jgi:hypothetical protein
MWGIQTDVWVGLLNMGEGCDCQLTGRNALKTIESIPRPSSYACFEMDERVEFPRVIVSKSNTGIAMIPNCPVDATPEYLAPNSIGKQ